MNTQLTNHTSHKNSIIETERLLLRPFQEGDETDLYEYLQNPEVHCFVDMKIDSLEQEKRSRRKSQRQCALSSYCLKRNR